MIKEIKGLLIDLDGVIYNENRIIEGSVETVRELRRRHVPFRFITNTTMKCRESLVKKLEKFGIETHINEIYSAAYAGVKFILQHPGSKCYLMLRDDARKDYDGLQSNEVKVDYVIAGDLGDQVNFETLNTAFKRLMEGAELIALQKNRFWMSDRGYTLDAGAFIALLEYAANKEAVVLGKPAPQFFELALADLNLSAEDVLMVGDDIESDISGAAGLNINTCLIRTGKFRQQDLDRSQIKPDHVIPAFRNILDLNLF
jgi:HAD superfamily hydrolase (TIGR01458 family)